jgi:tetratricopeptide (TPR) repeat protein
MPAASINCLAAVLKELGWSYTKLIAELRRHAAVDRIVLPKTESLIHMISRWVNNHQQPDDFYRDLLSRATGRPRFQLFSDEATMVFLAASTSSGIASGMAVGSDEDMHRRQLLLRMATLGTALAADPLMARPGTATRAGDALMQAQATPAGSAEREIVAAIRRVLLGHGLPLADSGLTGELDIGALDHRVRQAWELRQGSHYLEVGKVLPGLLADAQLASQELAGDQQARAFGLLAHSYNTASSVLRKLGDNGLAVIAADRAVQAARTVGEPLLLAASAYRLANVFLPAGRIVEAKEIALSAAGALEPRLDASTAHLASWGGLLLTAAIAAARQGDGREAWELVGESKAAARRLGIDHADLHTIFGPTSLAIQAVQVAAELGDGHEVLRRAKFVEPIRLPAHLVERRSHFLIDVARGHAHRADYPTALATLLEAERLAPEEVRYNPIASELVMVLLKRERRSATPGLRDLSTRIGIVA